MKPPPSEHWILTFLQPHHERALWPAQLYHWRPPCIPGEVEDVTVSLFNHYLGKIMLNYTLTTVTIR